MLYPRLLIALAFAPLLSAQYQDLTTDRHGAKLAFSSRLSLLGEQRNDQPKLFEIDVTGRLRTLRDTPPVVLYPGDRYPSNFPSLTRPEFNAAGTMLAFTGDRWCIGGSGCIGVERLQGNVLWLDGSREAPGSGMARISANGRWGVYYNHVPWPRLIASTASTLKRLERVFRHGTPRNGRLGPPRHRQ